MVTHLMGDHVGLSEITWSTEARLQVAEECEVDVELFVAGTVERTHGRLRHAAGRAHFPVIEDQRREAVPAVGLLEYLAPDDLGTAEDPGDELPHFVCRRALGRLARFTLGAYLLGDVQHGAGVETQEVGDNGDYDGADAEAASDHADSAPILDIVARLLVV